MTIRTLTMPRLGETMEEGTIAAWLIEAGTPFRRGQAILEVETDKTVVEYPALGDGVLIETLVAAGDVVAVDAPIARVEAAQWEDGGAPPPEPEAPAPLPAPLPAPSSTLATVEKSPVAGPPVAGTQEGGTTTIAGNPLAAPFVAEAPRPAISEPVTAALDGPLRATPAARRLARAAGVALGTLTGTGRRGRIEARDIPDAAPASVLLLHGFAGDGTTWAALTAALSRAGHRVSAPDLPGHGRDESVPQGVEDLLAAVTRHAAAQPGRLHLIGHSLGGHLAALMAAQDPGRIASLTLIAPAGLGREIEGAFIAGMAGATTAGEVAHLLRLLGPKAATLSAEALEAQARTLAQGRLTALAAAIAGPGGQRIDTIAALARLPVHLPIRVLIGRDDRIIPAAQLFNLPPRAAIHILPTGHMPHWDAPSEVMALITEALTHV